MRDGKKFLGIWLSDAGQAALAEQAKAAGVSKSEFMRRLIAYAAQEMPKRWSPEQETAPKTDGPK